MTRAIVFVRSDDFDSHATRCTLYAEEHGYELAGVVTDDWGAVLRMFKSGAADVAIISEESHLPAERKPRLEVVAGAAPEKWERRTRIRPAQSVPEVDDATVREVAAYREGYATGFADCTAIAHRKV